METDNRPWQMGYDLEYLKGLEAYYKRYNSYTFSPFAQYKKNNIANDLHNGTLKIQTDDFGKITATAVVQTVKALSDIVLYQNIKIGRKTPTDVVVTRLQGLSETAIQELLLTTNDNNTWVYTWAEDREMCNILENFYFHYVGPKVTSFGEIYAIYFKDASFTALFGQREHPKIDLIEWVSCKRIGYVRDWFPELVSNEVKFMDKFTNHYSNYNSKKSWSALSLRGYSSDPSFITKPSEMNEKWQNEHEGETFFLQDTYLCDRFVWLNAYLAKVFNGELHRIRFMKLEPGGGELKRHTDLVDVDSGLEVGKLARIHIPIITNDDVEFTVWDLKGNEQHFNMKLGEMWVLDTRKPHRVINKGSTARIHLVIDVVVDDKLYHEILRD